MPTVDTACRITLSWSLPCRSRRCRDRGCWRATARRGASCCGPSARSRSRSRCRPCTCCSATRPTSAVARDGGLDAARRRAVPLAQPRARALCRFRGVPREPAARQAQEDRAGAALRARGRRHLRDAGGFPDRRTRLGLLPRLLPQHLRGARVDALPHAQVLRTHAVRDAGALGDVRRVARRPAHRLLADRRGPVDRRRIRTLLGRARERLVPALRSLLLPAPRMVRGAALRALRGRRAGRAQDGARAHAAAHAVGALDRRAATSPTRSRPTCEQETGAIETYPDELDDRSPVQGKPASDVRSPPSRHARAADRAPPTQVLLPCSRSSPCRRGSPRARCPDLPSPGP